MTQANSNTRKKLLGFERYGAGERTVVRKPIVRKDMVLEQLKVAWEQFKDSATLHNEDRDGLIENEDIARLIQDIQGIPYGADDVAALCLELSGYEKKEWFSVKAGAFITRLIQRGEDREYQLFVSHLVVPISFITLLTDKKVTVDGNVGVGAGHKMQDGTLIISGNGGDIVGEGMSGGVIHLNDCYESLGKVKSGRIYHRGNLIIDV